VLGGWGEYDLDLYNGFFMGKMAQIHRILKEKNSKLPYNFDDKFK
jgi:hypothetical protein